MASLFIVAELNSIHFPCDSHQHKQKKNRLPKEIQSQHGGFQLPINPDCWALRTFVLSHCLQCLQSLPWSIICINTYLHLSPGHWDWCGVKMVLISISFSTLLGSVFGPAHCATVCCSYPSSAACLDPFHSSQHPSGFGELPVGASPISHRNLNKCSLLPCWFPGKTCPLSSYCLDPSPE